MVDSASEAREATTAAGYVGTHRRQEVLLIGASTKPGPCQVRSKTEYPYLHQAVMEIRGIPYCERCAREQEAYFAIGTLVMQPQGLESNLELARRIAEAGKH